MVCPAKGKILQDKSFRMDLFPGLVGTSPQMMAVKRLIGLAAESDVPVLIQGESGTGKELAAELIHARSPRSEYPLIRVNCAGLTETLLVSELFGHVKGAFTGAYQHRDGRFMAAHRGTIFLDEITSTSLNFQATLLRVVERGEFEPVGQSRPARVDARVISSSNIPVEQALADGTFRDDLFYRLNVISIVMPPLRNRKEDIPALVGYFLKQYKREMKKKIKRLSPAALRRLIQYHWPGNVRELANVLRRALALAPGDVIDLPSISFSHQAPKTADPEDSLNLKERHWRLERDLVAQALQRSAGVKKEAARMLGIDPRHLSYYLKKHGLKE